MGSIISRKTSVRPVSSGASILTGTDGTRPPSLSRTHLDQLPARRLCSTLTLGQSPTTNALDHAGIAARTGLGKPFEESRQSLAACASGCTALDRFQNNPPAAGR